MDVLKTAASALLIASTGVLAAEGFHMGAKVAGSYNMFWNTDVTIDANSLGVSAEMIDMSSDEKGKIKGFEKAGGMGVDFGLTFMLPFTSSLALESELLFSYRSRSTDLTFSAETGGSSNTSNSSYDYDDYGYTYDDDDYGYGDMSGAFTLNDVKLIQWYLEIPLMLRVTTAPGVYLGAGPVFSLNLDTEGKVMFISQDIDDYTSTLIVGVAADLGYALKLPNGHQLDFGFRFQMGLTSIISDEIEIPADEVSMKIDGTKLIDPKDLIFSLGVGYWFL